jgi:hypothetical protein
MPVNLQIFIQSYDHLRPKAVSYQITSLKSKKGISFVNSGYQASILYLLIYTFYSSDRIVTSMILWCADAVHEFTPMNQQKAVMS